MVEEGKRYPVIIYSMGIFTGSRASLADHDTPGVAELRTGKNLYQDLIKYFKY